MLHTCLLCADCPKGQGSALTNSGEVRLESEPCLAHVQHNSKRHHTAECCQAQTNSHKLSQGVTGQTLGKQQQTVCAPAGESSQCHISKPVLHHKHPCAATICTMAAYSLAHKTNIFKEVGAKAAVRHLDMHSTSCGLHCSCYNCCSAQAASHAAHHITSGCKAL
jgi:hypothetical protein